MLLAAAQTAPPASSASQTQKLPGTGTGKALAVPQVDDAHILSPLETRILHTPQHASDIMLPPRPRHLRYVASAAVVEGRSRSAVPFRPWPPLL